MEKSIFWYDKHDFQQIQEFMTIKSISIRDTMKQLYFKELKSLNQLRNNKNDVVSCYVNFKY